MVYGAHSKVHLLAIIYICTLLTTSFSVLHDELKTAMQLLGVQYVHQLGLRHVGG